MRKRIKVQRYIVSDQFQRFAELRAVSAPLLRSRELNNREDIVDGGDQAPEVLTGFCKAAISAISSSGSPTIRREGFEDAVGRRAMPRISTIGGAMALACAACQPLPDATVAAPAAEPQPMSASGTQPPSAQPTCSSYTVPLTVGGQPQNAVVEACQQADGSWRVTQTTPGLPPQVYEVPRPVASPYPSAYSYLEAYPFPDFSSYWGWDDWGWAGVPWFFGLGPSIVVVNRFNHFHHGFAHARGFGRGFGHGFGHGFASMRGGGMGGGGHR
jgi:hypothetical protein